MQKLFFTDEDREWIDDNVYDDTTILKLIIHKIISFYKKLKKYDKKK
jgi:hypothetical protein